MNRQYNIRQRTIEVSTQQPHDIAADALLIPWGGAPAGDGQKGLLAKAGPQIIAEIEEYGDERQVMLTSAGQLQVRFLFHLTVPEEGEVGLDLIEERFRDCFFQAGILGLSNLVIPITEFSAITGDFAALVTTIWQACSEFIARDRGPKRIQFLVDDRDLRGQYLRHFFNRKQSEDHSWEEPEVAEEVCPVLPKGKPGTYDRALPVRLQGNRERVITLESAATDLLLKQLDRLLDCYEKGDDPAAVLDTLGPQMEETLASNLSEQDETGDLQTKLRLLGTPALYRIPWELIHTSRGLLGENHLITRGTNFLHFSRQGGYRGRGNRASFRIAGDTENARELADEFRALCKYQPTDINWTPEQGESVRLVHCIGTGVMESLVRESDLDCELIFLDLVAGQWPAGDVRDRMDEWAGDLLAHGCRRVMVPLTAFRTERERSTFRQIFYKRILLGSSAGEALHAAQVALRELDPASGWFLYRLYGQTDDSLLPAVRKQQAELGETVPG